MSAKNGVARPIGRPKGNGKGHKIPLQYHDEIYQLYASGVRVSTIHAKIKNEWKIKISEPHVYALINKFRQDKRQHLNAIMDAATDDDVGRLNWLQLELELFLIEVRSKNTLENNKLFLQAADRLTDIFKLKLTFKSTHSATAATGMGTDHGREQLMIELKSKLVATNTKSEAVNSSQNHVS